MRRPNVLRLVPALRSNSCNVGVNHGVCEAGSRMPSASLLSSTSNQIEHWTSLLWLCISDGLKAAEARLAVSYCYCISLHYVKKSLPAAEQHRADVARTADWGQY